MSTDAASPPDEVSRFFDDYARALLRRDITRLGQLYHVPALILFPGTSIVVTDAKQTEDFFSRAMAQYEGVHEAQPEIRVMGTGPGTVWADVTWSYLGAPRERFCYQLVTDDRGGYRIAVLTLLDQPSPPGAPS